MSVMAVTFRLFVIYWFKCAANFSWLFLGSWLLACISLLSAMANMWAWICSLPDANSHRSQWCLISNDSFLIVCNHSATRFWKYFWTMMKWLLINSMRDFEVLSGCKPIDVWRSCVSLCVSFHMHSAQDRVMKCDGNSCFFSAWWLIQKKTSARFDFQ